MSRILSAILLAMPLLAAPALAESHLEGEVVSPVPEAEEDCDALRDSLASQRDDGILNVADRRELRDRGC